MFCSEHFFKHRVCMMMDRTALAGIYGSHFCFKGDASGGRESLRVISRAPWGKGAEFYEIYQSDATTSHKLS